MAIIAQAKRNQLQAALAAALNAANPLMQEPTPRVLRAIADSLRTQAAKMEAEEGRKVTLTAEFAAVTSEVNAALAEMVQHAAVLGGAADPNKLPTALAAFTPIGMVDDVKAAADELSALELAVAHEPTSEHHVERLKRQLAACLEVTTL